MKKEEIFKGQQKVWNNLKEIRFKEKCIEIVKQYLNHSSHNPYDTCLEEIIKEIKNI